MAKVIMVQGTMSGVGKSLLTAGLCRILKREGYAAAPFKSQNMALNSFITKEGLEMGRAQVMQAEAAEIEPLCCMNPVLLKPTNHTGAQVIVNGTSIGNMGAKEYFHYKKSLIPEIKKAFQKLAGMADVIVVEGAGSPAEVNLRENDIVNMGLAEMIDAPVLLAGDIDRGGVFAQLLGTLMLLTESERARVKGLIINKFRGDRSLLDSGVEILEKKGGVPVAGVVPYMDIELEDEDSLTGRFEKRQKGGIDIAVIRYPRISNFTDFNVFEQMPQAAVRYVATAGELGCPDILFLPGSKNTMEDLRWMRENGLEDAVKGLAGKIPICGICGGYQMLGLKISDPKEVEAGGSMDGIGLLPVITELTREKVRRQANGVINRMEGIFSGLSGLSYEGYEIHMGQSVMQGAGDESIKSVFVSGGTKDVYGTYVHGVFDKAEMICALLGALAQKKGIALEHAGVLDYRDYKEKQYEKLADILSQYLDMREIYGILREAHIG